MEGGLLLDVVVGQGSAIFELLSGEDQTLLVGRDTLLVLDLALDGIDSILCLYFEGDGFACIDNMSAGCWLFDSRPNLPVRV